MLSKRSKIKSVAKKLRLQLELEYNWQNNKSCFSGKCYDISKRLSDELNKSGLYSYRVMGQYMNADNSYTPDISGWDKFERDEYFDFLNAHAGQDIGQSYSHWWVICESRYIVDICVDQFFPDKEDAHRVIITSIGNRAYDG